jgi:hypothetical protein
VRERWSSDALGFLLGLQALLDDGLVLWARRGRKPRGFIRIRPEEARRLIGHIRRIAAFAPNELKKTKD